MNKEQIEKEIDKLGAYKPPVCCDDYYSCDSCHLEYRKNEDCVNSKLVDWHIKQIKEERADVAREIKSSHGILSGNEGDWFIEMQNKCQEIIKEATDAT